MEAQPRASPEFLAALAPPTSPPSPPPPTLAGVQIKGQRAPKVPTHTGPGQKQRSQGLCHITELLKATHTNAPLPVHRARWEQGLESLQFLRVRTRGPCRAGERRDRAHSSWPPALPWVGGLIPIPGGTPPPTLTGATSDTRPQPSYTPAPPPAPRPLPFTLWLVRPQTTPASATLSGKWATQIPSGGLGEHSVSALLQSTLAPPHCP